MHANTHCACSWQLEYVCRSGRLKELSNGQEEAQKTVPLEVREDIKHERRGLLSMARYDDPNSGSSSFSITLGPAPHLNMQYTIFGSVMVADRLCISCATMHYWTCGYKFGWLGWTASPLRMFSLLAFMLSACHGAHLKLVSLARCREVTDGLPTLARFEELPTKKEGMFVMPEQRITIQSTYVYTPGISMNENRAHACEAELANLQQRFDAMSKQMHAARLRQLP